MKGSHVSDAVDRHRRLLLNSLGISATALLLSIALAAPVHATQPTRRQLDRRYSEIYFGLGGGATLSPALNLSAGPGASMGIGFNIARELGITLGGAGTAGLQLSDGEPVQAMLLHLDIELMPRASQVETYGILGGGAMTTIGPGETQWTTPAARLGAGVDFWLSKGAEYEGGYYAAGVIGVRAVYSPSFGRNDGVIPVQHDVLIDLHFKLHYDIPNCLGIAGL